MASSQALTVVICSKFSQMELAGKQSEVPSSCPPPESESMSKVWAARPS